MRPAPRAALAPAGAGFTCYLDAVLAWRERPGNAIVTLDDPACPPALLTMPDPPALLYIKGWLELLHARGVAAVGSRSATLQGVEDAGRFAHALSQAGLAVVSRLGTGHRRGGASGRADRPRQRDRGDRHRRRPRLPGRSSTARAADRGRGGNGPGMAARHTCARRELPAAQPPDRRAGRWSY